jgi:hypothetical protein
VVVCDDLIIPSSATPTSPSCANAITLGIASNTDFIPLTNNLSYFKLSLPPTTHLIAGVNVGFMIHPTNYSNPSHYCQDFMMFVGYDNLTCPDSSHNVGAYNATNGQYVVPSDNMTSSYHTHEMMYLGVALNPDGKYCSGVDAGDAQMSVYTRGICPVVGCADIPYSACTYGGCACLPGHYGDYCNVTGPCDPFSEKMLSDVTCTIDYVLGNGLLKCEFADAHRNVSKYGECVLQKCIQNFIPEDNHCVPSSCDTLTLPLGATYPLYGLEFYSNRMNYIQVDGPVYNSHVVIGVGLEMHSIPNSACFNPQPRFNVYINIDQACPNTVKYNYKYINITDLTFVASLSEFHTTSMHVGVLLLPNQYCNTSYIDITVSALCPHPCPDKSRCITSQGCTCADGYYGNMCNITGVCNPVSPPRKCAIDGGLGFGYQECVLTPTTTKYDECVLTQCLPNYIPLDNHCVIDCTSNSSCSGHGVCSSPVSCECQVGFAGKDCGMCAENYYYYPNCAGIHHHSSPHKW